MVRCARGIGLQADFAVVKHLAGYCRCPHDLFAFQEKRCIILQENFSPWSSLQKLAVMIQQVVEGGGQWRGRGCLAVDDSSRHYHSPSVAALLRSARIFSAAPDSAG